MPLLPASLSCVPEIHEVLVGFVEPTAMCALPPAAVLPLDMGTGRVSGRIFLYPDTDPL